MSEPKEDAGNLLNAPAVYAHLIVPGEMWLTKPTRELEGYIDKKWAQMKVELMKLLLEHRKNARARGQEIPE